MGLHGLTMDCRYPRPGRVRSSSHVDERRIPHISLSVRKAHKQLDATPSRGSPTLQIIYVLFAESLFPLYASFMWNLLLFTCEGSQQTRGGSDGKKLCQRLLDACRSFDVRRGTSG
jgi:hypothetical protein